MKTLQPTIPDIRAIKARQKSAWESGDFGQVAKHNIPSAEEFMAQVPLRPGDKVLDAACGTGNLAMIAARNACFTSGLDIASNLIEQARARAAAAGLTIDYREGDVEALPYDDASFDAVVSMYGVMFAPRPERVADELARVTKPGGLIALANWTPTGFIGQMFAVFQRHLPVSAPQPSPLAWGDKATVRSRLSPKFRDLRLVPRIARLTYPFSPAATVEFFRQYYGPTRQAFLVLPEASQQSLRADLEQLQTEANVSDDPEVTVTPAEYLEIQARRQES